MIERLASEASSDSEYHCCVCRTNFYNKKVTLHGFSENDIIDNINSRMDLKKIAKIKEFYNAFFSNNSDDYNLFRFLIRFLNKDKDKNLNLNLNTRYLSKSKKAHENTKIITTKTTNNSLTIDQFISQNINNSSKLIILGRNHFNEYKRLRHFGFTNLLVLT
jgi:hypothetical protein